MGLRFSSDKNRPPNNFVGGLLHGMSASIPMPPTSTEAEAAPKAPREEPKTEGTKKMTNPGTMAELHHKTRNVFPVPFDGATAGFSHNITERFQVSHNFALNTDPPGSYRLSASWVGDTKPDAAGDVSPVLNVDVGSDGVYYANALQKVGKRTWVKCQVQGLAKTIQMAQFAIDHKTDRSTLTVATINPDVRNRQGTFVAQYLHNLTNRLALGAELTTHRFIKIPGRQISFLALSGRFMGTDYTISGSCSRVFMNLCYYQRASEELRFGVELKTDLRTRQAVGTFGFRVDLPRADLQFRGSLDSNGNVTGVLEKQLLPAPYCFTVSGTLNHMTNKFLLGVGFQMG